MGTTWVLDTETKGTGANMVPLERVTKRSSAPEHRFVLPERRAAQQEEPKPKPPRRFRILDVMTRQGLLDDGSAREAVDALASVRSIVDVNVYTWDDERERWLLLSFGEQRELLELAHVVRGRRMLDSCPWQGQRASTRAPFERDRKEGVGGG